LATQQTYGRALRVTYRTLAIRVDTCKTGFAKPGPIFDTIRCSHDLNARVHFVTDVMTICRWLPIMAAILFAVCGHARAEQPNGYPLSNVNLRAGPDTEYPVIVTVPNRAPISILGCLGDHTWCDVRSEEHTSELQGLN